MVPQHDRDSFGTSVFGSTVAAGGASVIKGVVCVGEEEPILSAIDKMATFKLSAIAVVDEEGSISTIVSGSDIRSMLYAKRIDVLRLGAMDFVSACRMHKSSLRARHGASTPAAVVVHPEDTLLRVLEKLAATKMHRVYVTDDFRKPVGVVSMKDFLRVIIPKVAVTSGGGTS